MRNGAKIEPELDRMNYEGFEKIEAIQSGIMKYLETLISFYPDCNSLFEDIEMLKVYSHESLMRLITMPMPFEISLLSNLKHEDNFGSPVTTKIVPESILKTDNVLLREINNQWAKYSWPQALLMKNSRHLVPVFNQMQMYRLDDLFGDISTGKLGMKKQSKMIIRNLLKKGYGRIKKYFIISFFIKRFSRWVYKEN